MISQPVFKDIIILIKAKEAEEDVEVHMLPINPFILLTGLALPELRNKAPEEVMANTFLSMLTEINREFDFYTGEYE